MGRITLEGVHKSFGSVAVIQGVDLDDRGRLVRRLRRTVGLRQVHAAAPDRRARGRDRRPHPDRRRERRSTCRRRKRGLSMVFQSYALYPHMSVRGNIGFGLKMAGLPRAEINTQGRGRGGDPEPDAVSRPQAARALRRPAPARRDRPRHRARAEGVPVRRAALQPRRGAARADAAGDHQLQQQLATTAIYVTHDQVEAMTMADQIVVLERRQDRADRLAARALRAARPICSSPASSARRR